MFSFFRKKPAPTPAPQPVAAPPELPQAPAQGGSLIGSALVQPIEIPVPAPVAPERQHWLEKLTSGLRKTGSSTALVHSFKGGSTTNVANIDRSKRWRKATAC